MTAIYHPDTQATVDMPETAVAIMRQAGWVTVEEWRAQETLEASRAAERAALEAERSAAEAERSAQKAARSTASGAAKEK